MDSIIYFFDIHEAGEALYQLAPLYRPIPTVENAGINLQSQVAAINEAASRGSALHAC